MELNFAVQTAFGIDNLPQVRQVRQEVFMEEQGFQNEFDATDETALHLLVLAGRSRRLRAGPSPRTGARCGILAGCACAKPSGAGSWAAW